MVPTSEYTTQTAWCWDSETWPWGLGQAQLHLQHEVRCRLVPSGSRAHIALLIQTCSSLSVAGQPDHFLQDPENEDKLGLQAMLPFPFSRMSQGLVFFTLEGIGRHLLGKQELACLGEEMGKWMDAEQWAIKFCGLQIMMKWHRKTHSYSLGNYIDKSLPTNNGLSLEITWKGSTFPRWQEWL